MGKVKKIIKVGLVAVAHPQHAKAMLVAAKRKRGINLKRRRDYIQWFDENKITDDEINEQKKAALELKNKPLISILIPTYNTESHHLRECIESVIDQTYTNWEICISDDASPSKETKDIIKSFVKKYPNIQAVFNKTNHHIAISSNIALEMAKGEYVSLLDHDDLLLPNALYETVKAINDNSEIDLIYTDEDKLEDDRYHVEPFFKPDWSPDFLNSCNYITHFATIRTSVMKEVKGFTPGTHGAQDWDLFFKITEVTNKIHHIPKILYTWRKSATSTAQSADSKPYAYISQKKVLRNSIARRGENAYAEPHPVLGFMRKKYVIKDTPLVSIIIPTKDSIKLIRQCIDSILEISTYPYFEIIIVDTGSTDPSVEAYYEKLVADNHQIKIVRYNKKFNFSAACNLGVQKSSGDFLLFLNNDTEVFSKDWVQGLLEHAQRKDIGMVGAKLLFPNETIQHAGIILSERDIAFHCFYGQNPGMDIFTYIYANNIRNVSAVTAACSMVSRKKFEEVGGFDTKLRVTYNDVDLNLRLAKAGYKNLYTPFVELFHYESMSVGRIESTDRDMTEFNEAKQLMLDRWTPELRRDLYYNDAFEQFGPGYKLPV